MAIEIKELVIKATINNTTDNHGQRNSTIDRKEIISDCVNQILDILKREKER